MVYFQPVKTPLQRLKQALEAHRKVLEELENALLEVEETFERQETPGNPARRGPELLSMQDVCNVLGMGKSWTYRKVKSGEIPSVKLGRAIKIKREDLEAYLENQRYQPAGEES